MWICNFPVRVYGIARIRGTEGIGDMDLTIRQQMTEEDFNRAFRLWFRYRYSRRNLALSLCFGCGYGMLVVYIGGIWWSGVIVAAVVCLLFRYLRYDLCRRSSLRHWRSIDGPETVETLHFRDDLLEGESYRGSFRVRLPEFFTGWAASGECLLLFCGELQFVFLLRRCFPDEAAWTGLCTGLTAAGVPRERMRGWFSRGMLILVGCLTVVGTVLWAGIEMERARWEEEDIVPARLDNIRMWLFNYADRHDGSFPAQHDVPGSLEAESPSAGEPGFHYLGEERALWEEGQEPVPILVEPAGSRWSWLLHGVLRCPQRLFVLCNDLEIRCVEVAPGARGIEPVLEAAGRGEPVRMDFE